MKQRDRDGFGAMLVLDGDNPTAKAAFQASTSACVETYLWGQKEQALARQMSENSAIFDFQHLDLSIIGVERGDLEAAWRSLSQEDRVYLLQSGWAADEVFRGRVNAALRAHGVRDNEEILFNATLALGAYTFMINTNNEWVQLWKAANP